MDVIDPAVVHAHSPKYSSIGSPCWHVRGRRADSPYQHEYRQCSYCGSIHPEDLLNLVQSGSVLESSTKSYKAYLTTPNPIAGQDCRLGTSSGPGYSNEIRGPAPATIQQKVYLDHFTPEQWRAIVIAAR